jgi:hypothetical protein
MRRAAGKVRLGSLAAVRSAEEHVCFALQSRPKWLVSNRPLCAIRRPSAPLVNADAETF